MEFFNKIIAYDKKLSPIDDCLTNYQLSATNDQEKVLRKLFSKMIVKSNEKGEPSAQRFKKWQVKSTGIDSIDILDDPNNYSANLEN